MRGVLREKVLGVSDIDDTNAAAVLLIGVVRDRFLNELSQEFGDGVC